MLNSVPVIIAVSTALGFLAGLGVGGGSLLILWLTLVLHTQQATARVINLLFFLPTAVISSLFRQKEGTLPFRKIYPGILVGCISAAVFSLLSKYIPMSALQKLFGVLLLFAGAKEIMYKPNQRLRKAK